MNHEPELVEEPILEQRPDEGAAADDRDVLAGLPLELGYPPSAYPLPLIRVELFHPRGSSSTSETTYLGTLFM
jgi:hypothetical protein